jgi:GNAT superfamily N-acetyltransferase
MCFTIRQAQVSDHALIVSGQIAMALESEALHLNHETVSKGVKAVLEDPHRGVYWIAEEAGHVAGCLLCIPEWSDWRNSTVLWIHSVYTWPQYRKRGVYKALYLFLKDRVEKSPDHAGLRLYVEKQNHIAQSVYQKLEMSGEHYHLFEWMK